MLTALIRRIRRHSPDCLRDSVPLWRRGHLAYAHITFACASGDGHFVCDGVIRGFGTPGEPCACPCHGRGS